MQKFTNKKSLGQNFLKSPIIVGRIAKAGKIKEGETVLEIGPGKGILTKALLEAGAKVISVEKDRELIPLLEEKFSEEIKRGKLILVCDDILNLDLKALQLTAYSFKLIANIPYYITGEILRKFLSGESKPILMVLLVQKEVAQRIIARDRKESILSLSVKAYGKPSIAEIVKKEMFSPSPKVDSAVLIVEEINNKNFKNKIEEENFFSLVKHGFAHKRKVLTKNIEKLFKNKQELEQTFLKFSIPQKSRAENLTLEDWLSISKFI